MDTKGFVYRLRTEDDLFAERQGGGDRLKRSGGAGDFYGREQREQSGGAGGGPRRSRLNLRRVLGNVSE